MADPLKAVSVDNPRASEPAAPAETNADVAELTLPVVPDELMSAASELAERFEGDPQLASVGISTDRSHIEVYWHGDVSEQLTAAIAATTAPVSIQTATYSPALLRQYAERLLAGDAGVEVASVSLLADGSGLEVALPDALSRPSARAAAGNGPQDRVRAFVDVPVSFGEAPEEALSRQSDTGHIGGARIGRYEDGYIVSHCTSAFAVIRPETGVKGVLTAAHCGQDGSTWVVHDGVAGSNSYDLYGTVVNRNELYDGAVIDSTFSYPYMFTSTWDSDVYTAINGLTIPVVGTEICYSGSYSGLVCGNIVTSAETLYTMSVSGGGTQSVEAFKTQQSAGVPSAGGGDSGGPGYVLTSTTSGYKRYAATIISAIQGGGSACTGVASSETRQCSATVLSASVAGALGATGWALQTYNN